MLFAVRIKLLANTGKQTLFHIKYYMARNMNTFDPLQFVLKYRRNVVNDNQMPFLDSDTKNDENYKITFDIHQTKCK